MKNGDEIKELFSKSFENFEKEVDPGLWDKIQSDLSSGAGASSSAGAAGKTGLIKTVVIGTVSVAAITGGVLFFTNSDDNGEKKNTKENVVNSDQNIETTNNNQENLIVIENKENAIENIEHSEDPLIVKEKEAIKQKVLSEIKEESPIDYTDVSLNDLLDQDLLNELSKKDEKKIDHSNNKDVEINNDKIENDIKKNENHIEHVEHNPVAEKEVVNQKSAAEIYLEKEVFNVLTPNNDGHNDYKVLECKDIKKFEVLIFNQSGKLVYEKSGRTINFDGTDNGGNVLTAGTYRMVVVAIDHQDERTIKKSHLTIIR